MRRSSLGAVVMLTFGPRPRTRAGLRRLRTAAPGVEVASVMAVPGSGGGGLEELAATLRSLPDGLVLLAHDDVAITARSVELLAAAVRRGTRFAVPSTNDEGTDHGCGPLPASDAAGPALAERERGGVGAAYQIERVRPVVVVAERRDLQDLVERRVHDPLTVLRSLAEDFHVVDGAVAAHDNSCLRRVRGAPAPGSEPLLVASMIVRDEEAQLAACLATLDGVVDRVVVCDTGSRDGTVAIARAAGADVLERDWRDDFGWARNEALGPAADATWVLWIDADERLQVPDPDLLRGYLRTYGAEFEALQLEIVNFSRGEQEAATTRFRATRLFRPDLLHFEGALHEQLRHRDGTGEPSVAPLLLAHLDHHGYTADSRASRGKVERNIDVSQAAYDRAPSWKTALDLARSLVHADRDPRLAADLFEEALTGMSGEDGAAEAFVRGQYAGLLVERLDDAAEAIEQAGRALALVPADPGARLAYAKAHFRLGRGVELVAGLDDFAGRSSASPVAISELADAETGSYYAWGLAELGRRSEARDAFLRSFGTGGVPRPELLEIALRVADGDEACLADFSGSARDPDDADRLIAALAGIVAPAVTASVVATHLERAGAGVGLVTVGALAAAVAGRADLADRIVAHGASRLDPERAAQLARRLDARGLGGAASALGTLVA